jgi:hypothetical protein
VVGDHILVNFKNTVGVESARMLAYTVEDGPFTANGGVLTPSLVLGGVEVKGIAQTESELGAAGNGDTVPTPAAVVAAIQNAVPGWTPPGPAPGPTVKLMSELSIGDNVRGATFTILDMGASWTSPTEELHVSLSMTGADDGSGNGSLLLEGDSLHAVIGAEYIALYSKSKGWAQPLNPLFGSDVDSIVYAVDDGWGTAPNLSNVQITLYPQYQNQQQESGGSSQTVTHKTNIIGFTPDQIGTFCETTGELADVYDKDGVPYVPSLDRACDAICKVRHSTSLNDKVLGIITDSHTFMSHGDCLCRVINTVDWSIVYELGDTLVPDIQGLCRKATHTERKFAANHQLHLPRITALFPGCEFVAAFMS